MLRCGGKRQTTPISASRKSWCFAFAWDTRESLSTLIKYKFKGKSFATVCGYRMLDFKLSNNKLTSVLIVKCLWEEAFSVATSVPPYMLPVRERERLVILSYLCGVKELKLQPCQVTSLFVITNRLEMRERMQLNIINLRAHKFNNLFLNFRVNTSMFAVEYY